MTDTPILHVDMDAFYASVALRERPDLVDQPVVVGGSGRGVVLAANYVARRYGVRSALPMTRARRLCPHVVVLEPDYATFTSVSASVMETFREITPLVEAMSLDEAFLDVRGSTRRLGPPERIAEQLRSTIHDEQGITCSVGVAASISVAKLASRRAKPDGVIVVPPAGVTSFLHPLDVGELYGVGEKTQALLHRFGLLTVGDLAHTPLRTLQRAVGVHLGSELHHLAWGTDRSELVPRPASVPTRACVADFPLRWGEFSGDAYPRGKSVPRLGDNRRGGTVELSEEELRLLEQMERALVEEDPKLASTLRGTSFQRTARRRMILGGVVLVAGIGLLILAVLLDVNTIVQTVVGVLGFVVMLGGAILALTSTRTSGAVAPKVRASSRTGFGVVDGGRPHRPGRQRSGSPFMERMEQRWRRRRERGL